jgi:hypothetical protein
LDIVTTLQYCFIRPTSEREAPQASSQLGTHH